MKKVLFLAVLSSFVLLGCPTDPVTPGTDAGGTGEDAPVAETDAPAATDDAPAATDDAPATPTDGALGLVEECQARAALMATNCEGAAGDPARVCLWNAYATLCEAGQAQLLLDSMNCLDDTLCRTFSDPNDGRECLDGVHEDGRSAAANAAIIAGCTRCGGTECTTVSGALELIPYLLDADIAALETCAGTACSIDDTVTNCAAEDVIAPFAACIDSGT